MLLFAIGLIGSGVLAVPVLTGSAASGVSEASRWRSGLERRPTRAPQFYDVIVAATLVGMAINFLGINPITALVWSAVLNGLIAPAAPDPRHARLEQSRGNGRAYQRPASQCVGWVTTNLMGVAAIGLIVTSIFG